MRKHFAVNGQVKGLQNLLAAVATMGLAVLLARPASAANASKLECVGDSAFGACASYMFSDQISSNRYQATLYAGASGVALYQRCRLGSAQSTLELERGHSSRLRGTVRLAGIPVSTLDRQWDGTLHLWTTPLIGIEAAGKVSFGFFELEGTAVASIHLEASINATYPSDGGPPVLSGSVGPVVDASVTGKADLNLGVGSIGIEADFTLVRASLKGNVTYAPTSSGHATVAYSVVADMQTPDGQIRAFGSVYLPLLDPIRFNVTLYDYNGPHYRWPLTAGVQSL